MSIAMIAPAPFCKAGKHAHSRVRVYTYKKTFRDKRYTHEVAVCLDCLKAKRNSKKELK